MITDPIENQDSRRPRSFPLVRVLRGGVFVLPAERIRAEVYALHTGRIGLRISLTLPCNDAGSVVQ